LLWPESGAVNPLPALDGLRALAVILVLLFHAWNDLPGYIQPGQDPYQYPLNYGRTGVHLFFVLSGFLLFLPFARSMFGLQAHPSARLFYLRRLLRVGPAYWACLVFLTIGTLFVLNKLADVALHAVFLSNAFTQTTFSINGVFWTMAVEVQYYAALPLIGWAAVKVSQRWSPRVAAVSLIGALVVISLCSNYIVKTSRFSHIPILSALLLSEYSLPFWLAIFGCGIACSIAYVYLTDVRRETAHTDLRRWGTGAFIVGVGIGLGIVFLPGANNLPYKDLTFGMIYAALLFGVLFGTPLASNLFASSAVRFIGLISYSLYLWHTVVLDVVQTRLPVTMPISEKVVIGCLIGGPLAIAVAYLSFQLFERPFIRMRKRAHETAKANLASAAPSADRTSAPPSKVAEAN
jgi:peptidoglycan/LPS O-acetylase OafA/YrhL